MKKLIYLFSITMMLTVFTSFNASASQNSQGNQDDQGQNNQDDKDDKKSGGKTTTALPINGGVEILMIAGVIIGIVAVKKHKAAKTITIQG